MSFYTSDLAIDVHRTNVHCSQDGCTASFLYLINECVLYF